MVVVVVWDLKQINFGFYNTLVCGKNEWKSILCKVLCDGAYLIELNRAGLAQNIAFKPVKPIINQTSASQDKYANCIKMQSYYSYVGTNTSAPDIFYIMEYCTHFKIIQNMSERVCMFFWRVTYRMSDIFSYTKFHLESQENKDKWLI